MCAIHGDVENIVFEDAGCVNTLDLVDVLWRHIRITFHKWKDYMFGFPLQIDQKNSAETQNMDAGSFS